MNIHCFSRELHPRQAFRIARVRRGPLRNVFVQLEAENVTGFGEASPNAFYGETAEGVAGKIAKAAPFLKGLQIDSVADIEAAWEALWPVVAPSRAAQCALDLALWDWLAKRRDTTVTALAWEGAAPRPVPTFCTIGLSTLEELPGKIEALRGFPLIKIKSDRFADLSTVRQVRARYPRALLALDANCSWLGAESEPELGPLPGALRELGVEFLEQPFPPALDDRLGELSGGPPLFADESCVTEADVEGLAAPFCGFNIKLVKCGGITPGLRMARRGLQKGLRTMVGCMLESSVLIAAGAVVAQQTRYADLDGAWLLADDPFSGWRFEDGILHPPSAPGLGVLPLA